MSEGVNPKAVDTDSSPNVGVIRGFYEAVARGDEAAVLDLLDPQVEWQAPESLPWGGSFHGVEGVREFLGKVADQPAEFRREVREYLDAGASVVVLLRLFGRPTGGDTEFEVPEIHVWTLRHGKIVGLEASFDTAAALRALELPPYYHVGILVADIEDAVERFSTALDLSFASIVTTDGVRLHGADEAEYKLRSTFSRQGPPYIELIEGQGEGLFSLADGERLHHIGRWVPPSQIAAVKERLGGTVVIASSGAGYSVWFAERAALRDIWIELVDEGSRSEFERWLAATDQNS
jgi:ketosteroid isomerase-like protein